MSFYGKNTNMTCLSGMRDLNILFLDDLARKKKIKLQFKRRKIYPKVFNSEI